MRSRRVLVVGPDEPDSFADNVVDALRLLGHVAEPAGSARRITGPRRVVNAQFVAATHVRRLDEAVQRHLPAAVRTHRADLVLSVDVTIRPATVAAMRRAGAEHVVLWYPDHVANLGNHTALVAGYDRVHLTVPPLARQLHDVHGLPVRYLPEAAHTAWHRPEGEYGTDPVVVMAGNVHPTRALLLERLLDDGVPLRLFGPPMSGWVATDRLRAVHSGRSVARHEKARVFRGARAVLNNLHPAELAGANCRLFEATGCGGAVLTEWRPGMEDLFVPGAEVLTFASYDELLGLCRRLLEDPAEGRAVADAGARRTAAEHTYAHRLRAILEDLPPVGSPG